MAATSRTVPVREGVLSVLEAGSGPLVLLIHGFPETARSWRHQLPALAAAGFRAVAVDVRGYGGSLIPAEVDAYRMTVLVGDMVQLVQAEPGHSPAVAVIGHDWGASIAAMCGLLRPDLFPAVGLLGVPYAPPGGPRPTTIFEQIGGPEEYYVSYFQEPGRAEAEIETDIAGWLAGFYAALDGSAEPPAHESGVFTVPGGARMRDRFPVGPPTWLEPAELDAAARGFARTGLSGALNRYRNVDRDWQDFTAWEGRPLEQPSLFIAGVRDASTVWLADAIAAFPHTLPGLRGCHLLEGVGHWAAQEAPAVVNDLLVSWLISLR
jgi:pimeloyl-ACP methyl ester carboxylesterase